MMGAGDSVLNGRLRDPVVYVLALIALGLGSGGGWLVGADQRDEGLALLRQHMADHVRRPSAQADGERLRALVQGEIDRSLRPIERELSEIRGALLRVNSKLDRALMRPAPQRAGEP